MADRSPPEPGGDGSRTSTSPRRPSLNSRLDPLTPTRLGVVAALSAVLAALSPARPVGVRAADVVWCALLGFVVPLVASRARRLALGWGGGVAAVVGIGGDLGAKAAAVALVALIVWVALTSRRQRLVAAVIGALAVQALLRGDTFGPVWVAPLIGAAALLPVAVSAWRMARRREKKVARRIALVGVALVGLASAGALVAALEAQSRLQSGNDGAVEGLAMLRRGDVEEGANRFGVAALQFERAGGTLTGPLTWLGRYVPVVGQHVHALRQVADAGEQLGRTASSTAANADYRSIAPTGGQVDLAQLRRLAGPVADSSAEIDEAQALLADGRSPWLVGLFTDRLDKVDVQLSDAADQARLAAQALQVAPGLLGGDGPRHYFLAFSTPAESRDGGGFIGAYGLLDATNGKLDLLESGSLGDANVRGPNALARAYPFDPPPDWDARYGSYFAQVYVGNLGASPDWPTDAVVAAQLVPQALRTGPIDGVMYADPAALAGLLRLTGPVTLPQYGVKLDADTAEQFLLREQYERFAGDNSERKELLGDVARAVFDALTERPAPPVQRLVSVLGPLVEQGHLRVATVGHPDDEAFLDRIGLSGRWSVDPGADVLSVRSANLFANKIDSFLHRAITVDATTDAATGTVTSRVTVELRNDAPGGGLPRYVIGNVEGLPFGTNRHLLTLHTGLGLQGVALDGEPTGTQTQTEFGGPVYSVVVDLPPGATRTLTFDLRGPVPTWPYRLQIVPQATANPDTATVTIDGQASPSGPLTRPLTVSAG